MNTSSRATLLTIDFTALSYSSIAPLMLGFATIGFYLLYLGFRYNALFTLGTNASTRGESYGRALQQLTTGIYLSEVCLIGLFAIGVASNTQSIGPLVLMVVFLVGTIAWHIWLRRSLHKMEMEMPEDTINPFAEKDSSSAAHDTKDGYGEPIDEGHLRESPAGNAGVMARFQAYFTESADVAAQKAIGQVAPHLGSPSQGYTQQQHDEAYIHPAIISECPIVWIARDKYGLSQQEIRATTNGEEYTMTDEGAVSNEKGKVEWKQDNLREAPIWEDEPTY